MNSASLRIPTMILLLWVSLGPVLFSSLSFFDLLPTRVPAVGHFATTGLAWRVLFFASGIFSLASAVLLHKRRPTLSLASAIVACSLYLIAFPAVWGQYNYGMALSALSVVLVGFQLFASRRAEV
jgi:hypothetical protein